MAQNKKPFSVKEAFSEVPGLEEWLEECPETSGFLWEGRKFHPFTDWDKTGSCDQCMRREALELKEAVVYCLCRACAVKLGAIW